MWWVLLSIIEVSLLWSKFQPGKLKNWREVYHSSTIVYMIYLIFLFPIDLDVDRLWDNNESAWLNTMCHKYLLKNKNIPSTNYTSSGSLKLQYFKSVFDKIVSPRLEKLYLFYNLQIKCFCLNICFYSILCDRDIEMYIFQTLLMRFLLRNC